MSRSPRTTSRRLLEVARWTGSSENSQPWQFLVIRDPGVRRRIGELSSYARHVARAPLAIAIVMPGEDAESEAYDEGRVAERILIAAGAMDLGAGIGWAERPEQAAVGELLGVTAAGLRADDRVDRSPDRGGTTTSVGPWNRASAAGRARSGALRRSMDEPRASRATT